MKTMLILSCFLLIGFTTSSCRTTQPLAVPKRSDDNPTQSNQDSDLEVPFTFIELKIPPKNSTGDSVVIIVKSASEVWCETRCSVFRLDRQENSQGVTLKAFKKSQQGNTSPSRLIADTQISLEKFSKINVNVVNFGKIGQQIDLKMVANQHKDQERILIVMSMVKLSNAIGGESTGHSVRIENKSYDVRFKDDAQRQSIDVSKTYQLTGYFETIETVERGTRKQFVATSADAIN